VQKCKSAFGLCKSAKVEGIFGSQVSALRSLVRVRGKIQILNLYPNLKT